MSLCKYKDLFGKPSEGVHQYRLFGVAIVDVIMTFIVGLIISKIFNIKLYKTLIVLFLLGIILHKLFCVQTTIDKLLFN